MRLAPDLRQDTTPQWASPSLRCPRFVRKPDFSVQAIDFIGFLSAFFVIVL
jgi:hypothetical protein